MSLEVETGSGSATSESYLSVADLKTYRAANYSVADPTTDEAIEQALRRGTVYVDGRYRSRFLGFRTNGYTQALEWPRTGVVLVWEGAEIGGYGYRSPYVYGGYVPGTALATNVIPQQLKSALAEAAIRELASPGSLTPDQTPSRRKIQQTVGPITTIWANDPATRPVVTVIDEILAPLLSRTSTYSGALVRA